MIVLQVTAPNLYVINANDITDEFTAPERFNSQTELVIYLENPNDNEVGVYIGYSTEEFYNKHEQENNIVLGVACEAKLISSDPVKGTVGKMWLIDDHNLDQWIEKWSDQLEVRIITDPV